MKNVWRVLAVLAACASLTGALIITASAADKARTTSRSEPSPSPDRVASPTTHTTSPRKKPAARRTTASLKASSASRTTAGPMVRTPLVSTANGPIKKAAFAATDVDVINPERGFLAGFDSPVTAAQLRKVRQDGFSLAHLNVDLQAFRGGPLSADLLAQVGGDFAAARSAGLKLIPRFAYDFTAAGNDAPLPVVLQQIDQLRPLLTANSDVILYLDAGFIGAWGEWHHSSNNLITHVVDSAEEVNSSTKQIVAALLTALPADRSILVRTQRYKYQLTGTTSNLSAEAAFSGTEQARIGFHNDCFLANSTDEGTYLVRASDEVWLSKETRSVPVSGETCADDTSAQPYTNCSHAISELSLLHWNSLSNLWHPDVLKGWKDQGCWWQIKARLGYRLSLLNATAPTSVPAGGSLPLSFQIQNTGFASLCNQRPALLILRNLDTKKVVAVPLAVDPRRWQAGATTDFKADVVLPASLSAGRYELLLSLPDAADTLSGNPAYSVRLVNPSIWEPSTGYNKLNLTVAVG